MPVHALVAIEGKGCLGTLFVIERGEKAIGGFQYERARRGGSRLGVRMVVEQQTASRGGAGFEQRAAVDSVHEVLPSRFVSTIR